MRRILLITMLFVSSSAFSQQSRRVNYYYYELKADNKSLIQMTSNVVLNVYLLDKENLQKYQTNQRFSYAFGGSFTVRNQPNQPNMVLPLEIVPPNPQPQDWYLVVDNQNGRPFLAGSQLRAVLFSKSEVLSVKVPPPQ